MIVRLLIICVFATCLYTSLPASEEGAALHQYLGNRALAEKRYDEAWTELLKSWQLDSTHAYVPISLARVAAARRDTPSVRLWLSRALGRLAFGERADPPYTLFSRHLDSTYTDNAPDVDKPSTFESARHKALGIIALEEQAYETARTELLSAYAHNPQSTVTARLLNRLYHETGDYGKAAIWHSQWRSLTKVEDRFDDPGARIRQPPKLIKSASPRYPRKARQAGVSGRVFIKFRISRFGRPDSVAILTGHELLRDEAIRTIKRMRFSPAITEAGDSVSVWMSQAIVFR